MILSGSTAEPLKYIDTSFTTTVDSTGGIQIVTMPGQGAQAQQRTGDQLRYDHFELNIGSFYSDNTNLLRVMLIQFHGPQGTGFTPANILANGPSGGQDPLSLYVPYIVNETFSVLWDKIIVLNVNSTVAQQVFSVKRLVPKIKKVGFSPNSLSAQQGQCYFVFISDSGLTPHPTLQVTCRTFFRDD